MEKELKRKTIIYKDFFWEFYNAQNAEVQTKIDGQSELLELYNLFHQNILII